MLAHELAHAYNRRTLKPRARSNATASKDSTFPCRD
jgi:hypothetical protein